MKNEKLIICGQSGSGKDYLLRQMLKFGLQFEPKITTRPKRTQEVDARDYYFVTNERYEEMLNSDLIFTHQSFDINGESWYYGISKSNFDNNQLFIMTPHEVSQIDPIQRPNCFVIYLDIDYNLRKERVSKRNDMNDSIQRRFQSDLRDFENFKDYDMRITDPEFDPDLIYDLMS